MIIDKNVFDDQEQCVLSIAQKYNFVEPDFASSTLSQIQVTPLRDSGAEYFGANGVNGVNGANGAFGSAGAAAGTASAAGAAASQQLSSLLFQYKSDLASYAFRVLMLGIFSSGKSAFLNKLIQQDLLTEAQAPETTLATELRFDIRNYIEAVGNDGSITEFSFEQAGAIPADKCRYLVYHLDNEFLRQHPDLVLVDMPGIDSTLEAHNKAIATYLLKGSAYILLVTAKEGSLRQSLVDFLKELNHYPQSLVCFVSMQDLVMPSELSTVVNNIQSRINAVFKESIKVQPISAVTDSQEDFNAKVEQAIALFDPQKLFEAKLGQQINNVTELLYSMLKTYRDSCVLDVSEIEEQINQCEKAKRELVLQLKSQEQDLELESSDTVEKICRDLENALHQQEDNLVSAAMSGQSALQSALCSIIRPVLLESSQRYSEESFQSVLKNLDLRSVSESSNDDSGVDPEVVGSKLQDIGKSMLERFNSRNDDLATKRQNATTFSLLASVAAISTSILNPIIELLIVFMPQILLALFGKDKESMQREKRENIKNEISSRIIPEVVDQLRPNILDSVKKQNKELVDQLQSAFMQRIEAETAALNQAKQDIATRTTEHEQLLADIDRDLASLQAYLSR